MRLERRIKKFGNEMISKYAKNPYPVKETKKKTRIPLWVIITVPSTLLVIFTISAISIHLLSGKSLINTKDSSITMLEKNAINHPSKVFNLDQESLSEQYVDAINNIANDLVSESQGLNKNLVFSPISIADSMFMFYDATTGETQKEIGDAFYINDSSYNHLSETKTLINNISLNLFDNDQNNVLYSNVSHAIFVNDEFETNIKQQYIDLLSNYYYSEAFRCDFNETETIEQMIKEYIGEKTNNHRGLLNKETESDNIRDDDVLLYSIMYLEASWSGFKNSERTTFQNFDGSYSNNVSFIDASLTTFVYESESYYIVQIPLYNARFFFNLMISKTGFTFNQIDINSLLFKENAQHYEANINLTMPEFAINNSVGAEWLLSKLGVNKLVNNSDNNDFGGISKSGNLIIDSITWGATLEVNINGLCGEASSGSGNFVFAIGDDETLPTIDLTADKPFYYSITTIDNVPVFVGQIIEL